MFSRIIWLEANETLPEILCMGPYNVVLISNLPLGLSQSQFWLTFQNVEAIGYFSKKGKSKIKSKTAKKYLLVLNALTNKLKQTYQFWA